MSAGCVRWVLSHTVQAVCGGSPRYWILSSRYLRYSERLNIIAGSWRWFPFSTAADDTEQTPAPNKKKQDPRAHATISSVGRKIPQRLIQVISETGENLGTMHRSDVIRIMDEQDLKLVLLSEHKDPPVYRLMSGKQIHEEQLKLREKQKAKAAPVLVKELTFSSGIASHDLTTKLKQVENWLEKKHHVRITLRSGRGEHAVNLGTQLVQVWYFFNAPEAFFKPVTLVLKESAVYNPNGINGPIYAPAQDTTLEQILQQMEVMVGFVSRPKVVREGRAAMCILRPPSAKELSQKEKNPTSQSLDSISKSTQSNTSPVSSTDTAEGSIQQ